MSRETQELFKFAYELRKIDSDNKYSRALLGQNLKSDILIQIICTNEWNAKNMKMGVNQNNKYKIQIGKGNKFVQLRKNFGPNIQVPLVGDKISLLICDTISFELKKQGTVLITCNGNRLACLHKNGNSNDGSSLKTDDDEDQDEENMEPGQQQKASTAVWVKNTHPLFESD